MNSKKLKITSAAIGASAVVAMGALTAALSNDSSSTTIVSEPEITTGETTTIEQAATAIETTLATPDVKVELPDGYGP